MKMNHFLKGPVTKALKVKLLRKFHSVKVFRNFFVSLHEVELWFTFLNALQQLATLLQSVLPCQQLSL